MKTLWNKFTSWLSGWPEGAKERIKKVEEDKPKVKPKKTKGLNPKKKKRKNMT